MWEERERGEWWRTPLCVHILHVLSWEHNVNCQLMYLIEHWSFQFPECLHENTVSVSCLDLSYSVTVKARKVKDEKKDETTAIVLGNLNEPEKDEEGVDLGENRKLCCRL